MARVSPPRLEDLVREAEVLSTLKASVPHAWKILEHEIGLARLAAAAADRPATAPPRPPVRKRVKLRVPAEQYPDYNFVGRLLGPRGATLKRLERDTACRIMIRGKGSIRKDKEAEVRGKPGWEHVFHEPLHVVIEVADAPDDAAAARTLARAKDLVELLLVPVPEERDSLKRAQLRDLAILNGTHRSVADLLAPAAASRPHSSPAASPPPPTRRNSAPNPAPNNPAYNPVPVPSLDPFVAGFDPPSVSFARPQPASPYAASPAQRKTAPPPSSSPASSPPPPPHTSYAQPPAAQTFAASSPRDSFLPDLEKLRIPSLDFDHLSESNLTLHSFGMPAASPTIVDPDIYPYPPTPGLLTVDHQLQQLNAFASPVWTAPSRPMSAGPLSGAAAALPPRSPHAPSDGQQHSSASFLLGRALGDPGRHQGSFHRSSSQQRDGGQDLPFEQAFGSQMGHMPEREPRDYSAPQPYVDRDSGPGGQSVLANFFPPSPGLSSHVSSQVQEHEQRFELRQQHFQQHTQFLQHHLEEDQQHTIRHADAQQQQQHTDHAQLQQQRREEQHQHPQRQHHEEQHQHVQLQRHHQEEQQQQVQRQRQQQHLLQPEHCHEQLSNEETTQHSKLQLTTENHHLHH